MFNKEFFVGLWNTLQNIWNTSISTFCRIFPSFRATRICQTLWCSVIHTELPLFALECNNIWRQLFSKKLFLGIRYLLQNIYDTNNNAFDQICSFTFKYFSKEGLPCRWVTSCVQWKLSTLPSEILIFDLPKNHNLSVCWAHTQMTDITGNFF